MVRPLSLIFNNWHGSSPFQEGCLNTGFSEIKYANIASFVGLEGYNGLTDINTFELHRSRIPTALFKSIVQDIDIRLVEYGPPIQHETEEARSRFLSPVSEANQSHGSSGSKLALRSLVVLLLCLTLLSKICPIPFLRVVASLP